MRILSPSFTLVEKSDFFSFLVTVLPLYNILSFSSVSNLSYFFSVLESILKSPGKSIFFHLLGIDTDPDRPDSDSAKKIICKLQLTSEKYRFKIVGIKNIVLSRDQPFKICSLSTIQVFKHFLSFQEETAQRKINCLSPDPDTTPPLALLENLVKIPSHSQKILLKFAQQSVCNKYVRLYTHGRIGKRIVGSIHC